MDICKPDGARKPRLWIALSIAAISLLVASPWLLRLCEGSILTKFLGNFHPVVLHLPIGAVVVWWVMWFVRLIGRDGECHGGAMFCIMSIAALSAFASAVSGTLLVTGNPEIYAGNDLVERHMWGGIAFAVLLWSAVLLSVWGNKPLTFACMALAGGVMAFTGHDGGTLTHGEGFLTKDAPWNRADGSPAPEKYEPTQASLSPDAINVYARVVVPIFSEYCTDCHEDGRAKGKLRMDDYDLLLKGGKHGPGVVPGDAEKSLVVVQMETPIDTKGHMPPRKEPQPSAEAVAAIRWWVEQGASTETRVNPEDLPDAVKAAMQEFE